MTIARAFVVLNLTQASVYTHKHTHTQATAGYIWRENRVAALLARRVHC